MSQRELSQEAQEILAAPEIFRAEYEISVRSECLVHLGLLTLLFGLSVSALFLAQRPFPSAWLVVAFGYPLIPWFTWFRPGIEMTRSREVTLTVSGLVIRDHSECSAWPWSRLSLLGITNYGLLGVFERPPKMRVSPYVEEEIPSLRVPYHPSLRELYVKLAEGEIQLPEGVQFTYFDHPRVLPAGGVKP